MKKCSLVFTAFLVFSSYAQEKTDMVNIKTFIPDIVLDIRYATTNNFTGKKIYQKACCFLRRGPAEKLKRVQAELKQKGLGLKIWDGYRPRKATQLFWDIIQDRRYVAHPSKGSRHNRGAAVDLTIVDKNGKELLMPTKFDSFTQKAHRDYMDLPKAALKNRELLESVMVKHGFIPLPTEWWHFDDSEWKQYDMPDVSFAKLESS